VEPQAKPAVAPTVLPRIPGVVPRGTPPPEGIRGLRLLLIKPSKYDDDGYVMRFVRGVLPSNTLATLAALTDEVVSRGDLGPIDIRAIPIDEHVQKVDPRRLARRHRRRGTRLVAALCGVQTNQFPRAADLARQLIAAGIPVMIGGFHVSGSIAMHPEGLPPECRELIDAGATLVKGEVEECWGELLRDALHGRLAPLYDVGAAPDLSAAEIPVVNPRLMRRYAYPYMGTIDAGRGCPFNCSFCCIINVQGRRMRHRPARRIIDRIARNRALRIDYYFFTDDDFARNPAWREIFDGLIELRRREGIAVQFMMQVDTAAHRLPGFIAKAAAAGCSQVFIGIETLRADNVSASGKRQNRVDDYREMIEAWHAEGIACHAAFIIGFPFDTASGVHDDVLRLRDEIGADQASFFMLTPVPGSRDHREMLLRGDWMDDDYNRFDSFHATMNHPRMSHAEWAGAYRQAWRDFYSVEGMKRILARANRTTYWGLFKNFAWYKYSIAVEGTHPMIGGFFRLKDRRQRRPGCVPESLWAHARRRARELAAWGRGVREVYFEMQEVWLATRGRARYQESVDAWRRRGEDVRARLGESAVRARDAVRRSAARTRAGAGSFVRRLNPLAIRIDSRRDLDRYWWQTWAKIRRGRLLRVNPLRLTINFLRLLWLCVRFNLSFLNAYGK
jgi:radical SAM superfamily enzyme YgiQ (UPF0313 family)